MTTTYRAMIMVVFGALLAGAGCGGGDEMDERELRLLVLINGHRAVHGRPPLSADARLARAASRHVDELLALSAWCQCLSHDGLDGSDPLDRTTESGYPASCVGENLTTDADTPDEVLAAWVNSPSHNQTLLAYEFDDIGISMAGGVAAAVLACR